MSAGEAVWLGGYIRDCLELFLEIVLVCNKMLALAVCAAPSRHANWESICWGLLVRGRGNPDLLHRGCDTQHSPPTFQLEILRSTLPPCGSVLPPVKWGS